MSNLLVSEPAGDGVFWLPPARPLYAGAHGCGRGTSEEHVSRSSCQLGRPADRRRLCGGKLRPTDKAMAARSVRTSPSTIGGSLSQELLLCAHPSVLSSTGDGLLGNNLLLSSSALLRLRLCEIALRAVRLGLEITLLEVGLPFANSLSTPHQTHGHVAPLHSWFFSLSSRLESSSQQESLSLRKVVLTSSTACRTRPRCCFLHT